MRNYILLLEITSSLITLQEIFLVTPPESKPALEAALSQNPHLTSLPSPKPDILAPEDLTNTSGTAEIFRIKEVRDALTTDFVVLPCDLVCELNGMTFLSEWMSIQAGFSGAAGGISEQTGQKIPFGSGGENIRRRGGMGVWYNTKGEDAIKGEETNFIATIPLQGPNAAPSKSSVRNNIAELVYSVTTDTLDEDIEEQKTFQLGQSVFAASGKFTLRSGFRDAHIYFMPYWALDVLQNVELDNLNEDVVGKWAKATWHEKTRNELGITNVLGAASSEGTQGSVASSDNIKEQREVADYCSTRDTWKSSDVVVPPMLAYTHLQKPSEPLIRRVDTTEVLLATSLRFAKLAATSSLPAGSKASPYAHPFKIAHQENLPRQTRVEATSCLVAENVTIEEKCNIKETVIGPGCSIGVGARLIKCLLMDDVVIGENVSLSGCVIGPRSKIEGGPRMSQDKTDLRDCEVQGRLVVPWGSKSIPSDELFYF